MATNDKIQCNYNRKLFYSFVLLRANDLCNDNINVFVCLNMVVIVQKDVYIL